MAEKQRYRMTFKCGCGNVFKKITSDPTLENPPCPECKKADKKTVFHRMGDGPVSEKESEEPKGLRKAPNTIYKCDDCFSITKIFQEIGEDNLSECPACDSKNVVYRGHISRDISTESANRNKCVDATANIVMEDYKLGNLKDDVKIGESMAPRLEPKKQALADNMFGGGKRKLGGINTAALAKRAMAGGMRDSNYRDPVAAVQPRYKPKVEIVAGDRI